MIGIQRKAKSNPPGKSKPEYLSKIWTSMTNVKEMKKPAISFRVENICDGMGMIF